MIFYNWKIPQKIAGICVEQNPARSADKIINQETFVFHFTYSSHKGCKGSNHWNKPGINNGIYSIFFKKCPGTDQSLFTDQPVILPVYFWTNKPPDTVINNISAKGSQNQ